MEEDKEEEREEGEEKEGEKGGREGGGGRGGEGEGWRVIFTTVQANNFLPQGNSPLQLTREQWPPHALPARSPMWYFSCRSRADWLCPTSVKALVASPPVGVEWGVWGSANTASDLPIQTHCTCCTTTWTVQQQGRVGLPD